MNVSEKTLLARVNRRLSHIDQRVRCCPEASSGFAELGRHYLVDINRNFVLEKHVDLQGLAQQLASAVASRAISG